MLCKSLRAAAPDAAGGGVNPHLQACRDAGVGEALLALGRHARADVYGKAVAIHDAYFGGEDTAEEEAVDDLAATLAASMLE